VNINLQLQGKTVIKVLIARYKLAILRNKVRIVRYKLAILTLLLRIVSLYLAI